MKYLVIARGLAESERLCWLVGLHSRETPSLIVLPTELSDPVETFSRLTDELDRLVTDAALVVALCSPAQLASMGAQKKDSGWETLVSCLVLAYPEIHWIFRPSREAAGGDNPVPAACQAHRPSELGQAFACPLFDPTGLRSYLRREDPDSLVRLAHREQLALSLDEERGYCHLHAFIAYRFGFCVAAITAFGEAERFLKAVRSEYLSNLVRHAQVEPVLPVLSFEDVFLNLPGHPGGLSHLEQRDAEFAVLKQVRHRVFVTAGLRGGGDSIAKHANDVYQSTLEKEGVIFVQLAKPHAGILHVFKESFPNESDLLHGGSKPQTGVFGAVKTALSSGWATLRGAAEPIACATGFEWPPPMQTDQNWRDSKNHSSPGMLLLVAQTLVSRAQSLWSSCESTVDAVRGAVLATDALELLGFRTPTLSFEALSAKHQFEVRAECSFVGVEHHMELRARIHEIRRDVRLISSWFDPSVSKRAALNAEMVILLRLVAVFREYGQFDEERNLMVRIRSIQHKLYVTKRWWRRPLTPFLWYIGVLLASFTNFIGALILWVVALATAAELLDRAGFARMENQRLHPHSVGHAVGTFFNLGDVTVYHGPWMALAIIAGIAGIAHLGIFISHLYTVASRN